MINREIIVILQGHYLFGQVEGEYPQTMVIRVPNEFDCPIPVVVYHCHEGVYREIPDR